MNASNDGDELLTPMDAARILGLSPDMIRVLSDTGKLPTLRTMSGRRLFRRRDVEQFLEQRSRQKTQTRPPRTRSQPPDGS